VAAEHPRRAPFLDTLERVMGHSIVVDGVVPPRRRAPAITPREWIDVAGDTFVVARVQPGLGDTDDNT
jgi:hypothetical protein